MKSADNHPDELRSVDDGNEVGRSGSDGSLSGGSPDDPSGKGAPFGSVGGAANGSVVYMADCDVGKGLFAACNIKAGQSIVPFSGPVISLPEVRAKGPLAANALQISPALYLDLQPPGQLANHSCEPNAGVFVRRDFSSGNRDGNEPAFELRALVNIPRNSEIRFDYSTTVADGWTMRCRCGAATCRRVVRAFLTLPRWQRDQYAVRGCVMPFILDSLGG